MLCGMKRMKYRYTYVHRPALSKCVSVSDLLMDGCVGEWLRLFVGINTFDEFYDILNDVSGPEELATQPMLEGLKAYVGTYMFIFRQSYHSQNIIGVTPELIQSYMELVHENPDVHPSTYWDIFNHDYKQCLEKYGALFGKSPLSILPRGVQKRQRIWNLWNEWSGIHVSRLTWLPREMMEDTIALVSFSNVLPA